MIAARHANGGSSTLAFDEPGSRGLRRALRVSAPKPWAMTDRVWIAENVWHIQRDFAMIGSVRSRTPRSDGTADLGTALTFLRALWGVNHAMERFSRSMQKRHGVTGPERLFIRVVGRKPGITPAELADILQVHRSSITPLIKKLERRRLIVRKANPDDARSFHLELTPGGHRIDALREGTIEEAVRRSIASTQPPDVATTSAMLVKLARRLTSALDRGG